MAPAKKKFRLSQNNLLGDSGSITFSSKNLEDVGKQDQ